MTVTDNASQEWRNRRERSATATIRFIVWVALHLGRGASRSLLYPICLYFLAFSPKARTASRRYLSKVLNRRPTFADLFRHYHTFAACLLDRVFLLNQQSDLLDIHVHGEDIAAEMLARGQGCLLLGAHFGSFEAVRAIGRQQPHLRVSLVMYEENARKINSVLNAVNPGLAVEIVALGKWNSMLAVEERLNRGEFVGMLADRSLEDEGQIRRDFLGEPAAFPVGPFRISVLLKCPIILMFGVYGGGRRYDIHFERLYDFSDVPHRQRSRAAEEALRRYVERLEHYCRLAPYNWFNFYDFWR